MHETDLIRHLSACFRRSPQQKNALFTSDAELVDIGGSLWGVTTDAFSPEEDCFGSDDPERIGHNVAVATLSDLLAAGCTPAFYLHSLDLPPEGESFGLSLSRLDLAYSTRAEPSCWEAISDAGRFGAALPRRSGLSRGRSR